MTTTQTKPSAAAGRARLIKLIHVARRDLERAGQLDEPGYRAILRAASEGRHDSSANMGYGALKVALARLEQAGFQLRKGQGTRPLSKTPENSKARALWLFLHVLGAVKDPSEKALAAYVRRIAKVDDLRFARGDRIVQVIESLKEWAMRFLPAAVAALKVRVVEAYDAGTLTPEQIEHALAAQTMMQRGEGFDVHWWAWESLTMALEGAIPATLADMPRREGSS